MVRFADRRWNCQLSVRTVETAATARSVGTAAMTRSAGTAAAATPRSAEMGGLNVLKNA